MIFSIVLLVAVGGAIFPAQAVKRFNSTIISERIIYHQNDYLSLEINGEGEDSVIYMNVDRPIDINDDIFMKMRLVHGGEIFTMPMLTDANLCTLLRTEANHPDGMEATYMMSQAFNIDGFQCPIQKTVTRLTPWILTKQHIFETDMPCGNYIYELILDQCRPYVSCRHLIIAELNVTLAANNCD